MATAVDFWSGYDLGWRYLAQRIIPGLSSDQWPWLDNELPLHGVSINDVLSGPTQLGATISPVYRRLKGPDGEPLLREWGTAIYAEKEGVIRAGGIYTGGTFDGPEWKLDVYGFTSYAKGMGYEGNASFVEADPLDLVRHIWDSIQNGMDSNIGLQVDRSTSTPVRVGKLPPAATSPTTTEEVGTADPGASQDDEPYVLNTVETDDLGEEIDTLAKDTPFDYHERHVWNEEKTSVRHFLDFGYPRLGVRRNLRFVLGENVFTIPTAERDGSGFANHVRVLGAGEGSEMVQAEARVRDGRLRRMAIVDDKAITDANRARIKARDILGQRQALTAVTTVRVRNTRDTPLGSWRVGDEIRLIAETDWLSFDLWFRVIAIAIDPEDPEEITMTILRADLVI